MLAHVVGHMVTKDDLGGVRAEIADLRRELKADIAALAEQMTSIERELRGIRRELDDLNEKVENIIGFRKEIDHALERIARIETHLGVGKEIIA